VPERATGDGADDAVVATADGVDDDERAG